MTSREYYLKLRKSNKIKASSLAIGMCKATISRFENGADITLSKFEKLIEMCDGEILIINRKKL